MQQSATSASGEDGDDVDRKAKLLALLDRARVNRGLQPEQRGDAAVDSDDASPPIKSEPMPVNSNAHKTPQTQEHQTPQRTCGYSHESPPAPTDAHTQIHHEEQTYPVSGQRYRASHDAVMATGDNPGSYAAVRSTGSLNSPSNSTKIQTAGENARQSDKKDEVLQSEVGATAADQPTHSWVAILSSTPKPRIAHLTGGRTESVPRLQQLRPLEMPRHNTHPEPLEEKLSTSRDAPGRAQQKQTRKPTSPSNTSEVLKKMTRLTADEYDDSELHGDFQHMLHILIPSNATTALLERRGQPIQSISQQTGCTLSIREPEASPFRDDRLLRIYGKAKCISLAQRLVIAYIRAYRAEKRDPNYMDLSDEAQPVALPATSITKAMSVAVASRGKDELEITSPFNWMVQRENIGKMMGKQGSILASIRRDTRAGIHLDKDVVPGTTERRVVLIGSVDSIAAAVEEIKSRAGGRPEVAVSVANGRLGQYFAIPYHAAGYLIGPQGSTVKSITERTGARLQIPSAEDLPLGSVNRILHMQGTPNQAEHARRVVSAKLRDYLASPKCPRTLTAVSCGHKGDKVTIKVLLPSRICGFMLDKRGKLIREISDKSGAHTFFLSPHDDENRVIAGDVISSKRVAPPRKRKRSQRDQEEEVYAEVAEEEEDDEYVEKEGPYYEDYYDEGYGENFDEAEYHDERPRQPARRGPRPREYTYIEDDYTVDEYDPDQDEQMDYEVLRPRVPKRQAVVRRQPLSRRRDYYANDVEEYENEVAYADDGGVEYEQSLPTRKQVQQRPPQLP
uniref:K Homology domain-containing protein n=1 Tax=Phytophthora ramorum TaxID=164328 RepID=H3H312_PHYRM